MKKVEISITKDKGQEKVEEKAKVEYLSPTQTANRNGNFVTIKNNVVSSKNKKNESSFPFYFLRVLQKDYGYLFQSLLLYLILAKFFYALSLNL